MPDSDFKYIAPTKMGSYEVYPDKRTGISKLEEFAYKWGKSARRRMLSSVLFSGYEFSDFKGMSKCNPIKVR